MTERVAILSRSDLLADIDGLPLREQNETLRFALEQILAPSGRNLWSDYGLRLTPMESAYLTCLVRAGRVVPKEELEAIHLDHIGRGGGQEATRQVIMKLRRKLAHLPCRIVAVWGEGYRLVTSGPVPWSGTR